MLTAPNAPRAYRLKNRPAWLPDSLADGITYTTRFSTYERRVMRRRKKVLPSEWAEKHRYITQGPMAGSLMRLEVTPHIAGQLDAVFFPSVRAIVVCAGPQSAKSTMVDTCMAYAMDMAPGPALSVYPDKLTGEGNCKERIHTMINMSPRLRRLKTGNGDDFTNLKVKLSSMLFKIGWSGSAITLSNDSYRYLDLQEVDKYPEAPNKREAGTIELAETRVTAFPNNHKIFITSTPTSEKGPVWQALTVESEVIFDYYARCPFCAQEQTMIFDRIKWPRGDDGHSLDYQQIENKKLAWYECENPDCAEKWDDYARNRAVQSRIWRERRPDGLPGLELKQYLERHRPAKIGFHQPSWISTFVSLSKVAGDWLRTKDPRKDHAGRRKARKNFYNKHRAEAWLELEIDRQEDAILALREEDRPEAVVPGHDQVAALVFGADTQDDGFFYAIYGIGYGATPTVWLIKDGFVLSFADLAYMVWQAEYRDAAGNRYPVQFGLIDAKGHRTSEVYDFCLLHPGLVLPSVGEQTMAAPYAYSEVEYYPGTEKRKFPGSLKRVRINTTFFKDKLDGKLRVPLVDPGGVRLHSDTSAAFAAQLCAESRDDNGFWQQIGNRPNHQWDCGVLAQVAAEIKFIRYWKKPGQAVAAPAPVAKKNNDKRERW